MARMARSVFGLFLPEGLLVAAAIGGAWWIAENPVYGGFARALPFAVFAAGCLLAWRFRRGRLFLALIVLLLADRALVHAVAGGPVATAVALLVPVNLAALAVLAERGTLTAVGLGRLVVLGLEVAVVAGLAQPAEAAHAHALARPFLAPSLSDWTAIPQSALLTYVVSFGVIAARAAVRPNATGRGFLWALVATFLGLHMAESRLAVDVFFGTASLILVVSVVEASYFMAYRDELTGLPGRRALMEALERLGTSFTIAMVDVDHFKQFNDTYGHDAGDQVLRMVARHLDEVGAGGQAFRYGGEEFTLLFPNRGLDEVRPHLEAVRKSVESDTFVLRAADRPAKKPDQPPRRKGKKKKGISVTVSVGAAASAGADTTAPTVLQEADRLLYSAKKAGRNRIAV